MRKFLMKDVRFIGSLAIEQNGSDFQRQLIERSITLSDQLFSNLLRWCFEVLVVVSFVACLCDKISDFTLSIRDDLALIVSVMVYDYAFVPTPQTG